MSQLFHHGIPGQKWGIRRGPPYPLEKNPNLIDISKKYGIIKTVSGHQSTPIKAAPYSIIDKKIGEKVVTRSFYNKNGQKIKEIHTNDHVNPKTHPYGVHGEHAHIYSWDGDTFQNKRQELDDKDRKDNSDIL